MGCLSVIPAKQAGPVQRPQEGQQASEEPWGSGPFHLERPAPSRLPEQEARQVPPVQAASCCYGNTPAFLPLTVLGAGKSRHGVVASLGTW